MRVIHETKTKTTWASNDFRGPREVEAYIEAEAAKSGGAWGYSSVFGEAYITRATTPSRLPDELTSLNGSPRLLFWKGEWRSFSEAVVIREQQRGLLAD